LLIIAFDTPERLASSASDQARLSRSSRSRAAIRGLGSSIKEFIRQLYETIYRRARFDLIEAVLWSPLRTRLGVIISREQLVGVTMTRLIV
jgi:hypothetical protein